jgi:putative peptidoglycan lipid II flippase
VSDALDEAIPDEPAPVGGGSGISFRSISRSTAILTGTAAATQVLAIMREVFVAANVGLSSGYDALLIALVIPTTLAGVLTAGTITALVPAYLEVRANEGLEAARRLAGAIMFWVALCGLAIWLALVLIGPVAIAIAGPGLGASEHDSAVSFLGIIAPVAFVSAITAILTGTCQAEQRFKALALSSLAGATATLVATIVLWQPLGLTALALASVAGPVSNGSVLIIASLRSAWAPRLTVWTSREQLSAFTRHAAPLLLSSAILQLNSVADRAIATLIGPGSVSALRYADVLVRTPIGAISPAWSTAIYPSLVRVAKEGRTGLGNATSRALRYVLAAFVPVAVLTAAVAPIAVAVGFGRGAFTAEDVARTAQAVAAFAPIIVVAMCNPPLTGALNARRRGGTLLVAGALNVALNFVLDVVLGFTIGAAGVALASSLTALAVLLYFARTMARSEDDFELVPIGRTVALALAASLPIGIPIALIFWSGFVPFDLVPAIAALAIAGVVGVTGYLTIARRLGLSEARLLLEAVAGVLARRRGDARQST